MFDLLHPIEPTSHESLIKLRNTDSMANYHEGLLEECVEATDAHGVHFGWKESPVHEHVVLHVI